jgi:aminomethyltransferase
MAEHAHTRTAAGLFDVSHMGQVRLDAPTHEVRALALESLIPMDVLGLGEGKQRYGLLTNDAGGISDDLMFTNRGDHIFIIVNGACKHGDLAWMREHLAAAQPAVKLTYLEQDALLALQGPQAVTALSRMIPGVEKLVFMTGGDFVWNGVPLFITRSGYTGEDGFEISVPGAQAETFARALLAQPEIKPIGLGARNSLRLEAGLCLYGNDIDETTHPVEAALTWAIQKVRRPGGERVGGYPGAMNIGAFSAMNTPAEGLKLSRKRVGLIAQERIPVRDGTELFSVDGTPIGKVTSGLLGPTINQPIAMGYVGIDFAATDTVVHAMVRGKPVPMKVCAMPFVPQRYYRG